MRNFRSILSLGLFSSVLIPLAAHSYLGGREGKISDHPSSVRLLLHFPLAQAESTSESEESSDEIEVQTAMCTAVKIRSNAFLTAAHCLVNIEGLSASAPVSVDLSQESFLDKDNIAKHIRPLKIKRLFVAAEYLTYGQGLGGISDIFDHLDLGVIEVEDGLSDIPVASLAPFSMKRNYILDVGGYGNTIVPEIPVIEEPFASHESHLRWDLRKVQTVKDKMLTLRSKPLGVTMTPVNPVSRSMMRDIKNARVNSGDSGGAAWVKASNGTNYVAAINSLFRPKIGLIDFFRKANTVEYLVRVDAGSPGYTWVSNALSEIQQDKLPTGAVYVR